jgi:hypothetical protein
MLPLTETQINELYGSLRRVLHECPASQIRVIAGAAGWDLGRIPDGLDENGGIRRPVQESAIDGQWAEWEGSPETRIARLRHLASELTRFYERKGMANNVQQAILKNGFRFENGDFVPVDAAGKIPAQSMFPPQSAISLKSTPSSCYTV